MNELTTYFFRLGEILLRTPEGIQNVSLTTPKLAAKDSIKFSKNINGSILDSALDAELPLKFCKLLQEITSYDLLKDMLVMNITLLRLYPKWGIEMLISDVLNILTSHLNPKSCIFTPVESTYRIDNDARYDFMVNLLMELLILLLELIEKESEVSHLKRRLSKDSTEALHAAILHYLPRKLDKYRKIRNEITHLTLILMKKFSLPNIEQSYFAKDLLLLSIATEVKDIIPEQLYGFQFTANNLDLEFKKTLILCSIYFIHMLGISKVMKDTKFFHGIFKIIYPLEKQHTIPWSATQWKEITEAAFTILPIILPCFPAEFVTLDIGKKMIGILQFYAKKKKYDIILQCVRALAATRIDETGYILNSLSKADVITFVGDLAINLLKQTSPIIMEQSIALHAITFLNSFVLEKKENFRMYRNYMFNLSFCLIKNYLRYENDPFQYLCQLTVLLTDILRECLNSSDKLKTLFLNEGGTFLILDLIEVGPFLTKVVSLGLLADLMAEGNCIPQVLLWKGKLAQGGRGSPQNQRIQELQNYNRCKHKQWLLPILMSTWRLEEEKIQVLRQSNGMIKDTKASLMGRDHRLWLTSREKEACDSFSNAELCGSGRIKIYCIVSLLKFYWKSKAAKLIPTFEEYTNTLDADDQTTLNLVENYPFLKKGEKWLETKVMSKVDETLINILCNRSNALAETVLKEQEELQKKGTRKELERERTSYEIIRRAHIVPQLEKKHQQQFHARTSNNYFLEKIKQQQETEINSSLNFPEHSRKYHTYTTQPRTTVVAANINLNY